ncbi:hypothetical protein MMC17_006887 [Xylographa soralifera]|nr:hypothetical protein [Xylographa soralifera]MCJ1383773.1 hypothetical protein [Xylographa soralifera]
MQATTQVEDRKTSIDPMPGDTGLLQADQMPVKYETLETRIPSGLLEYYWEHDKSIINGNFDHPMRTLNVSYSNEGDLFPFHITEDPDWMIPDWSRGPATDFVSLDTPELGVSPDHLHIQSTASPKRSIQPLNAYLDPQEDLSYEVLTLEPTLDDIGERLCKICRTESDLKRHMTKHTRPFQCEVHSCHVRPFGDRAGLLRHTREVHKLDGQGKATSKYICPEPSCTRHKKGFARQWNMAQHFRRAHTDGSEVSARQVKSSSPEASEDMNNAGVVGGVMETPQQSIEVCEGLRSKLALLQRERSRVDAVRTRVDAEIMAVQKVIEVFEKPAP